MKTIWISNPQKKLSHTLEDRNQYLHYPQVNWLKILKIHLKSVMITIFPLINILQPLHVNGHMVFINSCLIHHNVRFFSWNQSFA